MYKKTILFICGSMNQTTMMHQIGRNLEDSYECFYAQFYGDRIFQKLADNGFLDFTILGRQFRQQTMKYCQEHNLHYVDKVDVDKYDLILTCSDLIVPKELHNKKVVLVQEGMTDPENAMYYLVKWLKLPRYLASTATTGLSHAYTVFCVASEGYADHFIRKGVRPEKLVVTGIPNFDNVRQYLDNDFPFQNYVLAATSDARETFKFDNRKKFLQRVVEIANGRQIIFKLHPNENAKRAKREIQEYAPGSLVFTSGNTNHMIANCDVLVTQYSSVVYVGLALGKECYSYFNLEELRRLVPNQNGGTSALNIAAVCRRLLSGEEVAPQELSYV